MAGKGSARNFEGRPCALLRAYWARTPRPRALQRATALGKLRGERHDAHDHLEQAWAAGAAAAVVEAGRVMAAGGRPLLEVPDTRRALSDLATGHRTACPARFIGITGSAGKTTVKELTADLLQTVGPAARTQGNWNNDIGLPLTRARQ